MAWKSFYFATGLVAAAAVPFFQGSEGSENIPDGPCLLAANHSSFLDGPLLAMAYARRKLRPLHMIAYEEPFKNWLMGWVLRSGGCIPFRRGDSASQGRMLTTALGWLAAGEAVGIFPEGHINQQDRLGRARPGTALLALESQVSIVPAAILGSRETFPLGARFPRPKRSIAVRFGAPVHLFPKELAYASLPADERKILVGNLGVRVMKAIAALSGRTFDERRPRRIDSYGGE